MTLVLRLIVKKSELRKKMEILSQVERISQGFISKKCSCFEMNLIANKTGTFQVGSKSAKF